MEQASIKVLERVSADGRGALLSPVGGGDDGGGLEVVQVEVGGVHMNRR